MTFFTRRYGARPLHLVVHVAAFAIAAYAVAQIFRGGRVVNFIAWFAGAALLHDFAFLPLYSALDRVARHRTGGRQHDRTVPVINYLRVPAMISGLLLLIYLPEILGLSDRRYFEASGHHLEGYGRNWLLITAVLITGSAVLYALRLRAQARTKQPRQ
ncbi:MAG TPA: hypothetical protein VIX82_07135 [Solirubrobacteraceae bacterium]